jgi:hypothetical protein
MGLPPALPVQINQLSPDDLPGQARLARAAAAPPHTTPLTDGARSGRRVGVGRGRVARR